MDGIYRKELVCWAQPVFEDGLAGEQVSLAVVPQATSMCATSFSMGIDAMNFNYPDLLYVGKDGSSPDEEASEEEVVEGNVYGENGGQRAEQGG